MAGDQFDDAIEQLGPQPTIPPAPQTPNQYADTLATDQANGQTAPVPAAPAKPADPYAETIALDDAVQSTKIKQATLNPDAPASGRAADVLRFAAAMHLPPDVVDRNFDDISSKWKLTQTPIAQLQKDAPAVADYMAQGPYHAALAQADLEPLTRIERLLRAGTSTGRALTAGVMGFSRGVWGLLQAGAELEGGQLQVPTQFGTFSIPAEFAKGSQETAATLQEKIRGQYLSTPEAQGGPGFVERAVYSGVEGMGNMAPSLLAGALIGPAALIGSMASSSAGESYATARGQGLTPATSAGFGAIQGAIAGATALVPGHWFIKDLAENPAFSKMLLHQVASMVPAQEAQSALGDLTSWAMLPSNKDKPFSEYLKERPSAAAASLIGAIVMGGTTAVGGKMTSTMLGAVGDAAKESATMKSAPDQLGAIVDAATRGLTNETVYLPVKDFTEYYQKAGVDPRAFAAKITGSASAYDRALSTGEDLAVPMSKYVTEIASTDHNDAISQIARLHPDEMNAQEADAFKAEQERAAAAAEPGATTATQVRDDVANQLHEAGFERSTAETYAHLYEQAFGTLGARAGIDPLELYKRYGLNIKRAVLDLPGAERPAAGEPLPKELPVVEPRDAQGALEGVRSDLAALGLVPADGGEDAVGRGSAASLEAPMETPGVRLLPEVPAPRQGAAAAVRGVRDALADNGREMLGNTDFKAHIATMRARQADWVKQVSDEFGASGIVTTQGANGLSHVIHESTAEPGKFQVTSFRDGEPTGHFVAKSVSDAAKELIGEKLAPRATLSGGETSSTETAGAAAGGPEATDRAGAGLQDGGREPVAGAQGRAADAAGVGSSAQGSRTVEVPRAYAEHFNSLLADAKEHGYAGSDDSLAEQFNAKLDEARGIAKDLAPEDIQVSESNDLLRFIADAGGFGIEAEGETGMRGELEHMLENLHKGSKSKAVIKRGPRAGQEQPIPKAFRRSGGLPGIAGIVKRDGGRTADNILEAVNEDGRFGQVDSLAELLTKVDDAIRVEVGTSAAPETHSISVDSVLEGALHVAAGEPWWESVDLTQQAGDGEGDAQEPQDVGEGATSFNIREFDQGLFDELDNDPAAGVDVLATGELQPRLPGDVGAVRDQEVAQPALGEIPFSLTAPTEKAGRGKKLREYEMSPEYKADDETFKVAAREYDAAVKVFRASRGPEVEAAFRAARAKYDDAQKGWDAAVAREDSRERAFFGTKRSLFQSAAALTRESVAEWVKGVEEQAGPDLKSLHVYLSSQGELRLDMLAVDRGAQRAGIGSSIMRELTSFADQHGARVILSPAVRDEGFGTTSRARLVTFYKRFGFVENKGRNYDPSLSASMYREPSANARTLGPTLADRTAARPGADVTQTPEFKRFFGASKVVDEDGAPLVVYHGTSRGDRVGNTFRKNRATSGPMAFFTDDKAIAEKYSTGKADTSFEQPADYADWFKMKPAGSRSEVNVAQAWHYLTKEQRAEVIDKLPDVGYENHDQATGPIVSGSESIGGKDHIDYLLKEARGNGLEAAKELWLNSGALFNDEGKFLDVLKGLGLGDTFRMDDPHATQPRVVDAYLAIENPLVTNKLPPEVVDAITKAARRQRGTPEEIGADLWDKNVRDPKQWVEQLKADLDAGGNSFVWSSIPDWVTATLKKLGYDGIHDTGGKMGGAAHDVWVPFEPGQIKSATENRGTFDRSKPSILNQAADARRGVIRFGPDRQMNIDLLERADLSTFLHETGHFYLEVFSDVADALIKKPEAERTPEQQQLLGDWKTLLGQLGVQNTDEIGEQQHEQFARTFEAYLMKGEAPSPELRSTFARFRAWLVGLYASVKNLHVNLTPEVTRVLDRMLASDRAISDAEAQGHVAAMFTTPESAGMSPTEFDLYRRTVAEASTTAREQLEQKVLAEVQRERTTQWKAERAKLETEIRENVEQEPVYQAMAAITKGETAGGEPLLDGMETEPLKLSKQTIVDRFGADRLKRLPRGLTSTDGGLDPDLVAERFGFTSGDEMLTALEKAAPMKQVVDRLVSQRMLTDHGSMLLDGSVYEKARQAVANDKREDVVKAELRALAGLRRTAAPFERATKVKEQAERAYERRWLEAEAKLRIAIAEGHKQLEIDALTQDVAQLKAKARGGAAAINRALPPDAVLRSIAEDRIGGTVLHNLRPEVFWSAMRRAAREATEAAARQDFDAAITAKQQELLNTHLFRAATDAREDVDNRVRAARDIAQKPAIRARIGKAGEGFLDQIDGIIERYDFAPLTRKASKEKATLRKWAAAMEGEGLPVELTDEQLDDTRRVSFSELSYDELVGVTDGIKQIAHLAALKNKLLKQAAGEELSAVTKDVAGSIRANSNATTDAAVSRDRGAGAEKARLIGSFFASHRKISSLAREMDGGADGGAMWEHIIRPLNEAGDREAEMTAAASKALGDIVEAAYPGREKGKLYDRTDEPGIGRSLSKMERLMIALNWGNDGNRQRIKGSEKWSDAQVAGVLDKLDARDWQFVQGVWDHIDSYWPEIAAKQKRVTGLEPVKVEPAPIETRFGTQRGGYFPLKYDDRLSPQAGAHLDLEGANIQKAAAYVASTTRRGHTVERLSRVTLPVRYDFGVMFEHVNQVIHDLSHHETLIDVQRVLGSRDVQKAIYEKHGDLVYRQFKDGLRDIAVGGVPGGRPTPFESSLNYLRKGTTIASLGWNLSTAFLHPLGLTRAAVRIGPGWVARGASRWLRDAASMENTVGWINDKSKFMELRGQTQQREISEIRNRVIDSTGKLNGWIDEALRTVSANHVTKADIADSYFWLIKQGQRVSDVPTWLGQYEKSMAAGEEEPRAIALADQAVIDSQSAGQIKDLAAVQRGSAAMKVWTMFYSLFSATHNLAAESVNRTNFKSPKSIGRLAADFFLLYTVPATAGMFLKTALIGGPKDSDDAKKLAIAMAREHAAYVMDTMIGVRELSGPVRGQDYEGPAGARAFVALGKAIQQTTAAAAKGASGDDVNVEQLLRSLNDTAGVLFQYPSTQAWRTLEGIAALSEGKTKNPGVLLQGVPNQGRKK